MTEALVYLDHGATSLPKAPGVAEATAEAVRTLGTPGRGAHGFSVGAARVIEETRAAAAGSLGVADPRDLVFQPGATYALNLVLHGLLSPGDRVVVSSMEHNAVVRPLHLLERSGVRVDVVDADESGFVRPEAVEAAVARAPTRAVICQHVSNVTGTVQQVADMADIAHAVGAAFVVDGAQAAGHLDVDLGAVEADVYVTSGHKGLAGPQGVGLLYLAPGLEVRELVQGGTGSESESAEQPRTRPTRYEAGTPNVPGIAGLGAALSWQAEHGEEARVREGGLVRRLVDGLSGIDGVRVLGPEPGAPRGSVVSIVAEGTAPDRIAHELDRRGVAVRAGLHCAPWAHRTVGTSDAGAVRFGVGWSTTDADIDTALAALAESLGR